MATSESTFSGTCHIFLAFEVAYSIDLSLIPELVSSSRRARLDTKHRGPTYEGFQCPPVAVILDASPISVGQWSTEPIVEATIFDFGAISLAYRIAFNNPISDLVSLSEELYESELLREHARARLSTFVTTIARALTQVEISNLVEDYLLFELTKLSVGSTTTRFVTENYCAIAGVLTGEALKVPEEYGTELLSRSLSSEEDDVLLIDWHAAISINYEASDVRAVIEFANVELLELRFLDHKLDLTLEQAYRILASERSIMRLFLPGVDNQLRRLGKLQVDAAILFEGVNNSLKFFGDQFLARLYKKLTEKFALLAWDSSISRKLETIDSIYQKLNDQLSRTRMELLEVTIIILIVLSILLPH